MDAPGDIIGGRFELIERLGSGGMGTVWRARDTVLHREVALKAVRPDAEASAAVRERVLREARALARLSDPRVVTIHQIIDAHPNDHPWLVMELVPGRSLQQRLADGPLEPVEAARLGRQVLSALRAAHAAGIQHRDVKPANILLRPDGTAVLTDFGIAALQGSTALTATGELVGSPEYMAPERIRGTDDDPASDLWSLALVLYVCVEGVSPLRRPTTLATLAAVLDDPVPPPVRSGPLAPVLQALLVRDPSARPDAERLDAMLAQVEPGSGSMPTWTQVTVTESPAQSPAHVPAPPTPTQQDLPGPDLPQPGRGPQAPGPVARDRTPVLLAVAIAVAAVLAVVTAVTLTLVLRDGGGEEQAGGGTGSPATTSATATTGPTGVTTGPKDAPSPKTSTTPSTGPSATPSKSSPGTPVTETWIAQLYSEPVGSGTAARDRRLATIRETVPEATYVRSDDYASLRAGYWVIYAPGPFTDGSAALAFCAERGRTTANSCIGRYLSDSSADSGLQCRPPASNPTGRCTRT
ncbi:serine/threonine-protein kinase [Streptomyces phyllanthi]|uniref:non-specific serine/threonine protein kinase n=1 Tax=Streptomyces phyllanthi TaxID=1803180 RepID=A0A5N8WCQ8_9ACTN|nr:serine/threonine-protein kinase [Streptomyces phyllanthi]MPY44922.1 serine/threonine protein kinase [Streptomyces phyllanthi]